MGLFAVFIDNQRIVRPIIPANSATIPEKKVSF